jgi:hypothetical protein
LAPGQKSTVVNAKVYGNSTSLYFLFNFGKGHISESVTLPWAEKAFQEQTRQLIALQKNDKSSMKQSAEQSFISD